MKREDRKGAYMRELKSISLVVGLILLAASVMRGSAEGQEVESLRSDGEPLVTQFNSDTGKVRAVFLASPT